MRKRIVSTNLRLNLEKEADRRAWEYLQQLGRKEHKSYTQIIITAVTDFYDRQERFLADPYLETREKEDAFLQRILEVIEKGLQGAAGLGMNGGLLSLLQGITAPAPPPTPLAATDTEREEAINVALDFVNSL